MKNITFNLITYLSIQSEFEGEKQYTVENLNSRLPSLCCMDQPDVFTQNTFIIQTEIDMFTAHIQL